jgi:hypothetical protein
LSAVTASAGRAGVDGPMVQASSRDLVSRLFSPILQTVPEAINRGCGVRKTPTLRESDRGPEAMPRNSCRKLRPWRLPPLAVPAPCLSHGKLSAQDGSGLPTGQRSCQTSVRSPSGTPANQASFHLAVCMCRGLRYRRNLSGAVFRPTRRYQPTGALTPAGRPPMTVDSKVSGWFFRFFWVAVRTLHGHGTAGDALNDSCGRTFIQARHCHKESSNLIYQ